MSDRLDYADLLRAGSVFDGSGPEDPPPSNKYYVAAHPPPEGYSCFTITMKPPISVNVSMGATVDVSYSGSPADGET